MNVHLHSPEGATALQLHVGVNYRTVQRHVLRQLAVTLPKVGQCRPIIGCLLVSGDHILLSPPQDLTPGLVLCCIYNFIISLGDSGARPNTVAVPLDTIPHAALPTVTNRTNISHKFTLIMHKTRTFSRIFTPLFLKRSYIADQH